MGIDTSVIAIVTINFNNLHGLINTLESINIQKDLNFEHIIIDGGSTDGSVEFLRNFNFAENIKEKIISEPDKGIYDAMNKGIEASNAEYIMFLNSGDCFVSKTVVFQKNLECFDSTSFMPLRTSLSYTQFSILKVFKSFYNINMIR